MWRVFKKRNRIALWRFFLILVESVGVKKFRENQLIETKKKKKRKKVHRKNDFSDSTHMSNNIEIRLLFITREIFRSVLVRQRSLTLRLLLIPSNWPAVFSPMLCEPHSSKPILAYVNVIDPIGKMYVNTIKITLYLAEREREFEFVLILISTNETDFCSKKFLMNFSLWKA